MSKPIVAIVGRPNVGKSMLFSVIAGDTISIVKDTPSVTRDRIYADYEWLNMNFILIDTGDTESDPRDIILFQMYKRAEIAISTADVIVFIVDMRQGPVDVDSKVADLLRKSRKPVMLAVNRVDGVAKHGSDVHKFHNLGVEDPIAVSVVSWLGIGGLLNEVMKHFDSKQTEKEEGERPRIAVIGKPNMRRSSTINKPPGENRVIVPDTASTTRDAVNTEVIYEGMSYVFIDTAGLRRKGEIKEELERYSIIRIMSTMRRADAVVVVIDTIEGVTEQDAKIARIAHERGKGIIVAVNKWDAIEKTDKTIYGYTREIKEILSFIPYVEFLFISTATEQHLTKLFEMIDVVCQNQNLRVVIGVPDEIMTEVVVMQQPPSDKGKRLKVYYMTQVVVKPPTFVIFVNDRELMHFSYTRYLENQIGNAFGLKGISLKFPVRERKGKEQ